MTWAFAIAWVVCGIAAYRLGCSEGKKAALRQNRCVMTTDSGLGMAYITVRSDLKPTKHVLIVDMTPVLDIHEPTGTVTGIELLNWADPATEGGRGRDE